MPERKNPTASITDKVDAIGAATPTPSKPQPSIIPQIYAAGILIRIEEQILLNNEKVVCPEPINRPLKENTQGTVI